MALSSSSSREGPRKIPQTLVDGEAEGHWQKMWRIVAKVLPRPRQETMGYRTLRSLSEGYQVSGENLEILEVQVRIEEYNERGLAN